MLFHSNVCKCRFSEFSEWGQCQVLDLLMCYQIAVKDDIFDILVSSFQTLLCNFFWYDFILTMTMAMMATTI